MLHASSSQAFNLNFRAIFLLKSFTGGGGCKNQYLGNHLQISFRSSGSRTIWTTMRNLSNSEIFETE